MLPFGDKTRYFLQHPAGHFDWGGVWESPGLEVALSTPAGDLAA